MGKIRGKEVQSSDPNTWRVSFLRRYLMSQRSKGTRVKVGYMVQFVLK